MKQYVIAIDLGTTGCRSMVFDEAFAICGERYIEYGLIKLSDKMFEQDPGLWWEMVRKCVGEALKASGIDRKNTRAICVTSQGISFLPVNTQGEPLLNAISWLDTRSDNEILEILNLKTEPELFTITGKRLNAAYVLPKLLWLYKNKPEVYAKTHKFLMASDFINFKLCGRMCTDHTMASGTLLYDIHHNGWSEELLKLFRIDKEKLPEIVWSGQTIGCIRKEIAAEWGIPESTAVVMGGQDQKCAALGAGIDRSVITVSLGTASAITKQSAFPFIDKQMRIPCFSDLFKNNWILEGVINTAGAGLKWLKNCMMPDADYAVMNEKASQAGCNDVMFFPHLEGAGSPLWFSQATGCFYGLTLSTEPKDMIRALFEGVAFQIRHNLQVMQGSEETLRLFGGGAKSGVWCRMIANITGLAIEVLETTETACLGAAALAAWGSGLYSDIQTFSGYVKIQDRFEPELKLCGFYREKYKRYSDMEKKIFG